MGLRLAVRRAASILFGPPVLAEADDEPDESEEAWRLARPSERQLSFARKLGILVAPGMTRGDVSDLIDERLSAEGEDAGTGNVTACLAALKRQGKRAVMIVCERGSSEVGCHWTTNMDQTTALALLRKVASGVEEPAC